MSAYRTWQLIGLAIAAIAFWLIIYGAGWRVGLGVYLALFANNIHRDTEKLK